ncbi:MAG: hypothetical protein LBJ59_12485 [Zoogloeaceae bacterium]|jgi:hypothetical protein|nr:hypothetical protein [Zoogloeaceae bacterium]
MFRFLLFVASVMTASASVAGDAVSCNVAAPVKIEIPWLGAVVYSVAKIPDNLHRFRAFVTTVTEHIAARLDRCNRSATSLRQLLDFQSLDRPYP